MRQNLERLGYLFQRTIESPTSFLLRKGRIELRKRLYFFPYWLTSRGLIPRTGLRWDRQFHYLGRSICRAWEASAEQTPAIIHSHQEALEDVLANGWSCLGYGRVPIPRGAEWHEDRIHGREWPIHYFTGIDLTAEDSRCDIKVPWELSRLQFLIWISEAVVMSETEATRTHYLLVFTEILRDWSQWNPTGFGVNWVSAMEVGIRAINLILGCAPILDHLDSSARALVGHLIKQHDRYLARFPEVSDINGNHRLADLVGSQFLRFVLNPRDDRQQDRILRSVITEFDSQFETEGSHIERSVPYHKLCLEFAIYSAALQLRLTGSIHPTHALVLNRAFGFLKDFSIASGRYPVLGDGDSGSVVNYLQDSRSIRWMDHLAGGSGVLQAPERRLVLLFEAICGSPRPFGGCVQSRSQPSIDSVYRSGYIALRGHGWEVFTRSGAHGLAGRAPHDHDDNGAVWAAINGEDFLVERGAHPYTLSPDLRRDAIASSGHNLLIVCGSERFRNAVGSVFATARWAPIGSLIQLGTDRLTARSQASVRMTWASSSPDGETVSLFHQRELSISPDKSRLECQDRWESSRPVTICILWHFSPGWTVDDVTPDRLSLVSPILGIVHVQFSFDSSWEVSQEGYEYSDNYGMSIPSERLCLRFSEARSGAGGTTFYMVGSDSGKAR